MKTFSDYPCGCRSSLNNVVTLVTFRLPRRSCRRSEDVWDMLNRHSFFHIFQNCQDFKILMIAFLSYLTCKKYAFLDIFWIFFKNYPSDLDKLDIFEKYRSNYVDIAYSQPLQILCVDVAKASMYNFLSAPYNMLLFPYNMLCFVSLNLCKILKFNYFFITLCSLDP